MINIPRSKIGTLDNTTPNKFGLLFKIIMKPLTVITGVIRALRSIAWTKIMIWYASLVVLVINDETLNFSYSPWEKPWVFINRSFRISLITLEAIRLLANDMHTSHPIPVTITTIISLTNCLRSSGWLSSNASLITYLSIVGTPICIATNPPTPKRLRRRYFL